MDEQKWPQTVWLVRHGQSAGNVARDAAESATLPVIDIATRDMDTPLSALGMEQAVALGHWFGEMSDGEDRGRVLIIGGSHQMPGAIILAAIAALRAGAGKLTIATAARVAPMVAQAVCESRVIGLAETRSGSFKRAGARASGRFQRGAHRAGMEGDPQNSRSSPRFSSAHAIPRWCWMPGRWM